MVSEPLAPGIALDPVDEALDDIGDFFEEAWDDTRDFIKDHPIISGALAIATGTWFISAAGGFAAAGAKLATGITNVIGSFTPTISSTSIGASINVGSFASASVGAGVNGLTAFAGANVSILGVPVWGVGSSLSALGSFGSTIGGSITNNLLGGPSLFGSGGSIDVGSFAKATVNSTLTVLANESGLTTVHDAFHATRETAQDIYRALAPPPPPVIMQPVSYGASGLTPVEGVPDLQPVGPTGQGFDSLEGWPTFDFSQGYYDDAEGWSSSAVSNAVYYDTGYNGTRLTAAPGESGPDSTNFFTVQKQTENLTYLEVWQDRWPLQGLFGWEADTGNIHRGNIIFSTDEISVEQAMCVAECLYKSGETFGALFLGTSSMDDVTFWDTGLGKSLELIGARGDAGNLQPNIDKANALRREVYSDLRIPYRKKLETNKEFYDNIKDAPFIGSFSRIAFGEKIALGETKAGLKKLVQDSTFSVATSGGAIWGIKILRSGKVASNPGGVVYDVGRVPGPNPNNLRQRVVNSPTAGEGGVYLKPQNGRMKVGSTGDFRNRYGVKAPDGIQVEIPRTRTGPAADDSTYRWSPRRQNRFDEEYLDRITPNNVKYRAPNAKAPVDQSKWERYRHIFGYGDLPSDF